MQNQNNNKKHGNKQLLAVYVSDKTFNEIEASRGYVPRSSFVAMFLEDIFCGECVPETKETVKGENKQI
jgi:hypothetical protein